MGRIGSDVSSVVTVAHVNRNARAVEARHLVLKSATIHKLESFPLEPILSYDSD